MATVNDIDTKQSVGKFLQRQSVTPPADNTANTADEIQAVLETVATAFLLYPQAALTIILKAKNSLQQVVQADISVIDFLLLSLSDITNRDVPITDSSDLVEAQTALVELDRLGRVDQNLKAFNRYQDAINRFLNDQLAPTLKRNGTGTFERTGDEARQDLFNILPQFSAAHSVMISLLADLQNSVQDFQSVNLTKIVSAATISRVRSSLNRVKSRVDAGTISKTTAAIELLSGSASLNSISNVGDIFDPAISTGIFPTNTNIIFTPDNAQATALSTAGLWTLGSSPWRFCGTMDPLSTSAKVFNFEIPGPGVSGKVYVSSEGLASTLNIPASSRLYIGFKGTSTPEIEVSLTTGSAVPITTLVADINSAIAVNGSCISNPGTNGFIIYGSGSVTSITIRASSTGSSGTFSTNPSAHSLLGFTSGQTSLPLGQFNSKTLFAAIHNQLPSGVVTVEVDKVRITSSFSNFIFSSIFFNAAASNAVQGSFGFIGSKESLPSFVQLTDGNATVDPSAVGVYIGSVVTASEGPVISGSSVRTLNDQLITDIQGTKIFFDSSISIPRRVSTIVITSPAVFIVQNLIQGLASFVGTFDKDIDAAQRALSPIVSKPTLAQINDASDLIKDIEDRLNLLLSFLSTIVVRSDRSQFSSVADQIISSLEERGLDRAQEVLSAGQFSLFFSLDSSNASKSNRLLTAMETVARQDLPVSNLEIDIDDDQTPRGTNPDSNVLAGAELETSGTLVSNP